MNVGFSDLIMEKINAHRTERSELNSFAVSQQLPSSKQFCSPAQAQTKLRDPYVPEFLDFATSEKKIAISQVRLCPRH
jgi:hypothetical protein